MKLFLSSFFSLIVFNSVAQTCGLPVEPTYDLVNDQFILSWMPPDTECAISFYKVRYDYQPFSPELAEGNALFYIDQTSAILYDFEYSSEMVVYIRTVCDCNGDGTPENFGDGWAEDWIEMSFINTLGQGPAVNMTYPITIECGEPVPPFEYEILNGNGTEIAVESTFEEGNSCLSTLTYMVELFDQEGTFLHSNEVTYTFMDTSEPVHNCQGLLSFSPYYAEGTWLVFPDLTSDFEVEDCSDFTISQIPAPNELIYVTEYELGITILLFTDACGNEAICIGVPGIIPDPDFLLELSLENEVLLDCDEELPALEYTYGEGWDNTTVFSEEELIVENDCGYSLTYIISATDDAGNWASDSSLIEVADLEAPVLDYPGNITFELNGGQDNYTLQTITQFATVTDNCDAAPLLTQSIDPGTVLNIGEHTVTLTATDNCGNESTCEVQLTVSSNSNTDELIADQIKVYPNPVHNQLHVELSDQMTSNSFLRIVNMEGQVLYTKSRLTSLQSLNLDELASGIYILQIVSPSNVVQRSIHVNH